MFVILSAVLHFMKSVATCTVWSRPYQCNPAGSFERSFRTFRKYICRESRAHTHLNSHTRFSDMHNIFYKLWQLKTLTWHIAPQKDQTATAWPCQVAWYQSWRPNCSRKPQGIERKVWRSDCQGSYSFNISRRGSNNTTIDRNNAKKKKLMRWQEPTFTAFSETNL